MELEFKHAQKQNAEILIEIYNSAFHDDFLRYGQCPAYGFTQNDLVLKSLEKKPMGRLLSADFGWNAGKQYLSDFGKGLSI